MPQEISLFVVRAHLVGARRDHLRAEFVLPHEGRGPVAALFASVAPQLLAGRGVERHQEGLVLVVVHDVELPVVHDRRCSRTPAEARPHHLEAPLPDRLAVHREGEDADVAEVGVDPLAVRDRGLRGVGVLQVAREVRRPDQHLALPTLLSGFHLKAVDRPVVLVGGRLHPVAAEVEALLRLLDLALAPHRGEEDAVALDDG